MRLGDMILAALLGGVVISFVIGAYIPMLLCIAVFVPLWIALEAAEALTEKLRQRRRAKAR
jgi:hypothetical protein